MLSYGLMVDKGSMFNLQNCRIFIERMLAWLQGVGGVSAITDINQPQADALYGVLDSARFWVPQHPQRTAAL